MHIALLFEYGTLNGGEQSMLAVLDQLRRNQCPIEFTAIAPADGRLAEALQQREIRHVPINLQDDQGHRLTKENAAAHLQEIVKGLQPDMLHANSLSMGRLTGAVADQLSCPTVAHLRDIIRLSKAAISDLNRNTGLIAVSHATRDYHVAQGLDEQKCRVNYNGVDCELFMPRPKTNTLTRELGLPDECLLVANIGQIGLRKGQDLLIKAWQHVAAEFPFPYCVLLLIGERNSTKQESVEYEQQLHVQAQQSGLEQNVCFLGYRDDLPKLYNEFDLLVHAAHQEPLGRVLLEAAAAGVSIVATEVGGTSEILQHEQSALLVPDNNAEQLADAMKRLLSDQTLRAEYAAKARRVIEQRFAISMAAENLQQLWQEIIG